MTNYSLRQFTWLLIPLIAGVLLVVNITASNLVSTTGQDLNSLKLKSYQLELTNSQLRHELALKGSLVYLTQKSQELGFTSPASLVYLKPGPSLAQR